MRLLSTLVRTEMLRLGSSVSVCLTVFLDNGDNDGVLCEEASGMRQGLIAEAGSRAGVANPHRQGIIVSHCHSQPEYRQYRLLVTGSPKRISKPKGKARLHIGSKTRSILVPGGEKTESKKRRRKNTGAHASHGYQLRDGNRLS